MKNLAAIGFLLFCFAVTGINSQSRAADNLMPASGVFGNQQCIQCHEKVENKQVKNWRNSVHAKSEPVVDCVACHGNEHESVMLCVRQDQVCTECHGGAKSPVVHSYASSKHGVLMQIEGDQQDWTQPLLGANYRTPGCSYCHMHAGEHDVGASVRQDLMVDSETEAVLDRLRSVCQDCHSPRYVARLMENGEAMLEIARKKIREADRLIKQAAGDFSEEALKPARQQMKKMRQHLLNVHLGVGHQSPDYQWWHGQPALDGDLIRIKGVISELRRASFPAD
jgi:hypothetical protein